MDTMLPHVSEMLSYITEDLNRNTEPSGVMRREKTNAILNKNSADFFDMHEKILEAAEKKEIKIFCDDNDSTDSYAFISPYNKKSKYKREDMFSVNEINDTLKSIASFYSDQEYRFLKEYFRARNFLRSPHKFAGAPVEFFTTKTDEKKALTENLKSRGKILDDDFAMPDFKFWSEGESLSQEEHKMIAKFERENGYPFDTHMLKDIMGIDYLANYQIDLLLNLTNYNFVAASRRAGKSLIATYIAVRQTFIPNQTILYVMPSESYFFQPLTYIDRLIGKVKEIDPNLKLSYSDGVFRNNKTKSSIKLVSASMRKGIRSFDGDLIIVDEAAFVPEKEFFNLQTIIEQKIGMSKYGNMICITTIDEDTPYNWFYDEMISAELSNDPIYYTNRISIFDNPFFSKESRDRLIKKYKDSKDHNRARCELFAEFPPKNQNIPLSFFPLELQSVKTISIDNTDIFYYPPPQGELLGIFIGYDPAKKQSKSGYCASALYKQSKTDPYLSEYRTVIIASGYMPDGMKFQDQISYVINPLYMEMRKFTKKVFLCFDENGVGAPVREMIDWKEIINLPVHYATFGKAGGKVSKIKDGILYVDKKYMMSNFLLAAEGGLAVSYPLPEMKTIIAEIGTTDSEKSKNILAASDLLNALYIAYISMQHFFPGSLHLDLGNQPETKREGLFRRAITSVRDQFDPRKNKYKRGSERINERMKKWGY